MTAISCYNVFNVVCRPQNKLSDTASPVALHRTGRGVSYAEDR